MASITLTTLFLLTITITTTTTTTHTLSQPTTTTSLYLSPKTLFSNYNKMLLSFKIFTYPPPTTTPQQHLFYTSLLHSPFLTQDPNHAHLFFLPFPSSTSTRQLARVIKNLRITYPFWNRTLGADHFYLSPTSVDFSSSDRNVLELKKNSIQISSFPTSFGSFIPHKDVTLPPLHSFQTTPSVNGVNRTEMYLGYMKLTALTRLTPLIEEITSDPDFKVEYETMNKKEKVKYGRFCLFVYGSEMTWMVEAMGLGCVPVVITDRPIQDLPLMDVIDWSKMAVFVGAGGGVKGLKRVLDGIEKSRYEKMVESGVAAVQHLVWNAEPQPYDAFHMVVYQLWLRRHTIRYARWVEQ